MESTAAGAKLVTWESGESIFNFWKPFYLAWLLVLWLGPASIIGRGLAANTQVAWVWSAVPVLVAWLLYPVSQLSSLSASSVWMPLTPQVFARLAQKPAHPLDAARAWTDEDEDTTPYAVNPSEAKPEARVPEAVLKPRAEEMALLDRRDAPKPPKRGWTADLFAFLGQPASISALVVLSGLGTFAGVMVRVARQFNPTSGE